MVTCMQVYLGGSVTTSNEPMHANLTLKTKNRINLCKLKWYHKVMCINDIKLPFQSLSNEWYKVTYKGHLTKCWLGQVNSLRKEPDFQDKVF